MPNQVFYSGLWLLVSHLPNIKGAAEPRESANTLGTRHMKRLKDWRPSDHVLTLGDNLGPKARDTLVLVCTTCV